MSGTTNPLYAVDFVDENNGIAAGNNIVLHTANGGQTWTNIYSSGTLNGIDMVSAESAYGVGEDGLIVHFTGAGLSVENAVTAGTENFNDVYFVNNLMGYAVGDNGSVYKWDAINNPTPQWTAQLSTNSEDWMSENGYPGYEIKSVYFKDYEVGYATGEKGIVLKTITGGERWFVTSITEEGQVEDINDVIDISFEEVLLHG